MSEQVNAWHVLVLNGPNLNLLGEREAGIYGRVRLADIEADCRARWQQLLPATVAGRATLDFFQSNHEGVLVDRIQEARGRVDLIVFNPAAFTHTSVALRDALLAVAIPVIEVHISNIHQREPFRHHSYISDIALGQIVGLGAAGYRLAVEAAVGYLSARDTASTADRQYA
ncbi:MAG: type II 3-dehydroquinate dehydratase [Magnetococcales bacterium]|nr:type II 3-dehydroquinate dehydratase [Magnetococcales bacterium]